MALIKFIKIAHGLIATTYGWGEFNCGPVYNPQPCDKSAITASGERFDPGTISAAVAAPEQVRVNARYIAMRVEGGPCLLVRVNDKMNPRFIGERGFDLSPAAVEYLTGEPPVRSWTGRIYLCDQKDTLWEQRLNLARFVHSYLDYSGPARPV